MKTVIEKNNINQENTLMEWTPEEKKSLPPRYSCELVLENATPEQYKDSSLPSDGYLVFYTINEKNYVDVCRAGKRANIFDLYYDKFGPGVLQKIDFGYGRLNPKLWGYKAPEKKRRK